MVIVVMGLPGVGKSSFAKALARRLRAWYINSDIIRKQLGFQGKYDPEDKWKIYEIMREELFQATHQHDICIVDATFYKREIRDFFTNYILFQHTHFSFIEITAADQVIQERLVQKRQYSEADYQVHLAVKQKFEMLKEPHLTLDSSELTPGEMVDKAVQYLGLSE